MAPITMYGIKNCDTIKKARKWLDENKVEYRFHDYKKEGVDEKLLKAWCSEIGFDNLLNRRGTSWRKLSPQAKASINETTAIKIMLENPSIIKRPLLDTGQGKLIGFSDEQYRNTLKT